MKAHHIGIIVRDMEKSIKIYSKMGYVLKDKIIADRNQNNRIAFLTSAFSIPIELIEPIDESSSIYNLKISYHHICYEAERGEDIVTEFKKMQIGKVFTQPIHAPAIDNRQVVFAYLRNETFVELII